MGAIMILSSSHPFLSGGKAAVFVEIIAEYRQILWLAYHILKLPFSPQLQANGLCSIAVLSINSEIKLTFFKSSVPTSLGSKKMFYYQAARIISCGNCFIYRTLVVSDGFTIGLRFDCEIKTIGQDLSLPAV